jgi:hypothetical protein
LAKGFILALAVIAGVSGMPRPAAADEAPDAFIRTLGAQALAVIRRPDLPPANKMSYFSELVRQDFDLMGISRFRARSLLAHCEPGPTAGVRQSINGTRDRHVWSATLAIG